MLTQILENNNISLPDCSKKKEGGSNSEDRERIHALVAGTSSSPIFIIESRASRHMVSKKETFSSLDMSKGPPMILGNDSLTKILGKGRIDLNHGKFNNVFYVLGLSSNLLSMYKMTHIGSPKKFIFSPNEFEITEISSGKSLPKELQITLQRYTCSHTSYPNQTPLLF